jgi:hypothetical protein
MLLFLALYQLALGDPAPQCLVSNGIEKCGYDCKALAGAPECARTPAGVCHAAWGKVVCFDPPEVARVVWGAGLPKAQCKDAHGQIACGYGCAAGFGKIGCAQTPAGTCRYAYRRLECWDPPPLVLASLYERGEAPPRAQCLAAFGHVGCGYRCQATTREVRCAETPYGICRVRFGKITCFDPDLP